MSFAATTRRAGTLKLAIVDSHSFWVYGYFEETRIEHVKIGDLAEIRRMSGGVHRSDVRSTKQSLD
jgi:multidrug resistance efflux pump